MMNTVEESLQLFNNEYNCAQSILVAFAPKVGIDHSTAFRIAAGLGGGIGRTQNVCGAINAGAIVLGYAIGNYTPGDAEAKKAVGDMVGKFVNECKQVLGTTQCLEITKIDLNNDELRQWATDKGFLSAACNNAVEKVAQILESYLDHQRK
jgi:C_GCAxxG_C_C family probable redox protein